MSRSLTSRMRGFSRRESIGGVTVHRSTCVRRDTHYTTALELSTTLLPAWREGCRLIEAFQPDLLHTHFVLPSGVIAWRLARRYRRAVRDHGARLGYPRLQSRPLRAPAQAA